MKYILCESQILAYLKNVSLPSPWLATLKGWDEYFGVTCQGKQVSYFLLSFERETLSETQNESIDIPLLFQSDFEISVASGRVLEPGKQGARLFSFLGSDLRETGKGVVYFQTALKSSAEKLAFHSSPDNIRIVV